MYKTKHAQVRMSQRAIRDWQLELLHACGQTASAPGGALKITATRKAVNDFIMQRKKEIQAASKLLGLTVIEKDGFVLTAYKADVVSFR